MVHHKLAPEYNAHVQRFAVAFPIAHEFLRKLEVMGPSRGLWLSTSVNAHLYKAAAYLAYLKLKNPERKPPSLVISPHYNQQIAAHTTDESGRLFPALFDGALSMHAGQRDGWAERQPNGATELGPATPAKFFDTLYQILITLDLGDLGDTAAADVD